MPGCNSSNALQTLEHRISPNQEQTISSPPDRMVDQAQTIWEPYKNRFRVLAACLTAFGNGMNDSANGALIESIEKYRSVSPVLNSC